MNAQELFLSDGKAAGVFFCGSCKTVHDAKGTAESCCEPYICSECGELSGRKYYTICNKCQSEKTAAAEKELFDNAEKITGSDNPIFNGDDFYMSMADLLDDLQEDEFPEYVWATNPEHFVKLDADSIIESVQDDAYDDFDIGDLCGVEEFQDAVAAFNSANHHHISYLPDYTRAIIVDQNEK